MFLKSECLYLKFHDNMQVHTCANGLDVGSAFIYPLILVILSAVAVLPFVSMITSSSTLLAITGCHWYHWQSET